MQKFETLRQPLLGVLAMSWTKEREKERRREKNAIDSGQGQRTHSARTNYLYKEKDFV
jgi:hypothetical protein